MSQLTSFIIVIVFMIALSLTLNFIGDTLLEIMMSIFHKAGQRNNPLNSNENIQYDRIEEDNELDTSKISI